MRYLVLATLGLVSCGGGSESAESVPDAAADAAVTEAAVDAVSTTDASVFETPPSATTCPTGPVSFPGAEGFGACAKGGRGGRVLHVTTLAASGAGSLQAALDESGPRTVVFDVSGVVAGVPILSRGQVTIAGETSPGGVILRGLAIQGDEVCESDGCPLPKIAPSDVIVRFVRLRPAGEGDDGLRLHRAKNVIVDHVSIGNASDEAVQLSLSSDVTIQNTLLAETTVEGHDVQYGGMLMNYSDPTRGYPLTRLSIHHDVWNRIAGRLPEMSRENFRSDEGHTSEVEVSSNLYWDPQVPMPIATRSGPWDGGKPVYWRINLVDDYFVVRETFPYGLLTLGATDAGDTSQLYLSGVGLSRYPKLADYALEYCCNDFATAASSGGLPWASKKPSWAAPARHPFPAITYDARGEALIDRALATVGALPRDPMDRRLMRALSTRVFDTTPLDRNPAKDALALDFTTPPAPPKDGDRDGIPDDWEASHGLDPKSAADGALLGSDGYSNLEKYLFARVATLKP